LMPATVAGASKTILTSAGMVIFFSPPVYSIVRTWSLVSRTEPSVYLRFSVLSAHYRTIGQKIGLVPAFLGKDIDLYCFLIAVQLLDCSGANEATVFEIN
jgi:hypothetical protein